MDQLTGNDVKNDVNLEQEVTRLIVSALRLDLDPLTIGADTAIYGEGLGLDSIDILEVALLVSKTYGVQLKADSEDNFHIFKSLRSLSAYIGQHRTQ